MPGMVDGKSTSRLGMLLRRRLGPSGSVRSKSRLMLGAGACPCAPHASGAGAETWENPARVCKPATGAPSRPNAKRATRSKRLAVAAGLAACKAPGPEAAPSRLAMPCAMACRRSRSRNAASSNGGLLSSQGSRNIDASITISTLGLGHSAMMCASTWG